MGEQRGDFLGDEPDVFMGKQRQILTFVVEIHRPQGQRFFQKVGYGFNLFFGGGAAVDGPGTRAVQAGKFVRAIYTVGYMKKAVIGVKHDCFESSDAGIENSQGPIVIIRVDDFKTVVCSGMNLQFRTRVIDANSDPAVIFDDKLLEFVFF